MLINNLVKVYLPIKPQDDESSSKLTPSIFDKGLLNYSILFSKCWLRNVIGTLEHLTVNHHTPDEFFVISTLNKEMVTVKIYLCQFTSVGLLWIKKNSSNEFYALIWFDREIVNQRRAWLSRNNEHLEIEFYNKRLMLMEIAPDIDQTYISYVYE